MTPISGSKLDGCSDHCLDAMPSAVCGYKLPSRMPCTACSSRHAAEDTCRVESPMALPARERMCRL